MVVHHLCCLAGTVKCSGFFLPSLPIMKYTLTEGGKIVKARLPNVSETTIQINCVRWFDIQYSKLSQLLFHIPNGGKRSKREAATFKRMGVRRGVADLYLSIPNRNFHGLYVETKTIKGQQSAEQAQFQKKVESIGYRYAIVDNVEQFIFIVQTYMQSTPFFHPTWRQIAALNTEQVANRGRRLQKPKKPNQQP